MWKIVFRYIDGKITVSNKTKPIDLRLAELYYKRYGLRSDGGMFYQYPLKNNKPIALEDLIKTLKQSEVNQ